MGPVPGQHVELLEGSLVQQVLDPLPGGELALGVVAFDGPWAAGVEGLVLAFGQLGQAFGHGVFHALRVQLRGAARNCDRKTPNERPFLILEEKYLVPPGKIEARGPGARTNGPTAMGGRR